LSCDFGTIQGQETASVLIRLLIVIATKGVKPMQTEKVIRNIRWDSEELTKNRKSAKRMLELECVFVLAGKRSLDVLIATLRSLDNPKADEYVRKLEAAKPLPARKTRSVPANNKKELKGKNSGRIRITFPNQLQNQVRR
jgi:hypothetical protein